MTGLLRAMLWFVLALVGLLVGAVEQARAGFTLTLTDPNPTVVRPTSGTTFVDFKGTITWSLTSSSTVSMTFDKPYDSSANFLNANLVLTAPDLQSLINANGPPFTGSYTALLFIVGIDATSPLGLYDLNSTLVGPPTWVINVTDSDGLHSVSSSYSVNVVNVPEPSPLVLALSGVALIGLGLAWRRRWAAA